MEIFLEAPYPPKKKQKSWVRHPLLAVHAPTYSRKTIHTRYWRRSSFWRQLLDENSKTIESNIRFRIDDSKRSPCTWTRARLPAVLFAQTRVSPRWPRSVCGLPRGGVVFCVQIFSARPTIVIYHWPPPPPPPSLLSPLLCKHDGCCGMGRWRSW